MTLSNCWTVTFWPGGFLYSIIDIQMQRWRRFTQLSSHDGAKLLLPKWNKQVVVRKRRGAGGVCLPAWWRGWLRRGDAGGRRLAGSAGSAICRSSWASPPRSWSPPAPSRSPRPWWPSPRTAGWGSRCWRVRTTWTRWMPVWASSGSSPCRTSWSWSRPPPGAAPRAWRGTPTSCAARLALWRGGSTISSLARRAPLHRPVSPSRDLGAAVYQPHPCALSSRRVCRSSRAPRSEPRSWSSRAWTRGARSPHPGRAVRACRARVPSPGWWEWWCSASGWRRRNPPDLRRRGWGRRETPGWSSPSRGTRTPAAEARDSVPSSRAHTEGWSDATAPTHPAPCPAESASHPGTPGSPPSLHRCKSDRWSAPPRPSSGQVCAASRSQVEDRTPGR